MKFRSLKEVAKEQVDAPKIIVYGAAGTGKTTALATLPGRVLILSAEAGLASLAACERDDITVIEIKTVQDLKDAFAYVKKHANGDEGFDVVAMDSLSEICEVILAEAKQREKDGRAAYGVVVDEAVKIVKAFRDVRGVAVVLICKEERVSDDGKTFFQPLMPGAKIASHLPYLFDCVFRADIIVDKETKERQHVFFVRGDKSFTAKDRTGALESCEWQDFSSIMERIRQKSLTTPVEDNGEKEVTV